MSTDVPSARDLTRSLTARRAGEATASEQDALAVLQACERACSDLARSLGVPGFTALLRRAKAGAERRHPILADIQLASREPFLAGVNELLRCHEADAVIGSLEAVLDTMFSVLGGLIGLDMVARLVQRDHGVDSPLVEDAK